MSELTPDEVKNSKYEGWVNIYNSKAMNAAIDEFTNVTNKFYEKAGDCEKRRMHEFFKRGLELEILFWDEMYSLA